MMMSDLFTRRFRGFRVVELGGHVLDGAHGRIELLAFAQQGLRLARIVPQRRVFGERVELVEAF